MIDSFLFVFVDFFYFFGWECRWIYYIEMVIEVDMARLSFFVVDEAAEVVVGLAVYCVFQDGSGDEFFILNLVFCI